MYEVLIKTGKNVNSVFNLPKLNQRHIGKGASKVYCGNQSVLFVYYLDLDLIS